MRNKILLSLSVLVVTSSFLQAQIGLLYYGVSKAAKKNDKQVFKGLHTETGYSLMGMVPDTTAKLKFKEYSFFINATESLQLLKKNWLVRKLSNPVTEQAGFKIYALYNHTIKQEWTVYPQDSVIYTLDDYYQFDISLLRNLAIRFPLEYETRIDSFANNAAFAVFKEAAFKNESLLFIIDPGAGFEGNFQVTMEKSEKIKTFQDAVNELDKYCSQVSGKTRYSITIRDAVHDFNQDNQLVFTVRSDKELYDNYRSDRYIKGNWRVELLFSTSYWRK